MSWSDLIKEEYIFYKHETKSEFSLGGKLFKNVLSGAKRGV